MIGIQEQLASDFPLSCMVAILERAMFSVRWKSGSSRLFFLKHVSRNPLRQWYLRSALLAQQSCCTASLLLNNLLRCILLAQ